MEETAIGGRKDGTQSHPDPAGGTGFFLNGAPTPQSQLFLSFLLVPIAFNSQLVLFSPYA